MAIALALSGGANKGPFQVGALRALLEGDIVPDVVTGTSVGSLNATWFCWEPTLQGITELMKLWLGTKRQDVFPGNYLVWIWRMLWGEDAPIPNTGLRNYIQNHLPQSVSTFRDLKIPLYVVTTDLLTNTPMIYGDDLDTPLVEPLTASAAFPYLVEPVLFDDMQLTDGGLVEYLPISLAALHATTVYALDLDPGTVYDQPLHGWINLIPRKATASINEQRLDDLQDLADDPMVDLHHIHLRHDDFEHLDLMDFDPAKFWRMYNIGYEITKEYLRNPQPNVVFMD